MATGQERLRFMIAQSSIPEKHLNSMNAIKGRRRSKSSICMIPRISLKSLQRAGASSRERVNVRDQNTTSDLEKYHVVE